MYGDYGYMEEGQLGKAYNVRLLKRLAHYALPYKKMISFALLLTIMITVLDLALPYLAKISVDRYILASWYRVDLPAIEKISGGSFIKKFGPLIEMSKDGSFGFLSHMYIKKLDPAKLHEYRQLGLISKKAFYIVRPDHQNRAIILEHSATSIEMADGSIAVPIEALKTLNHDETVRIRAADLKGVALMGIILLVFLLFSFILGYGEYYLLELAGQKLMLDIRLELFNRMQIQSVSFFDRHPVGRLVTRVTNDIENLNEMFKSVVVTVFKDIFIITGILVVLLYLNWRLALVCVALIPVIFGITLLFSSMARDAFRELRQKVAKINVFLQERLSGMRIIQLFAREAHQMKHFIRINHENYLAGMRQIRIFAIFMPLMDILASFALALVIWYGGGKVVTEQLTLGTLVAFISYIRMFFSPIRDISEKYNIMQAAMASTERILEFMDHKEIIPEPDHPKKMAHTAGHLQFKDVFFAYRKDAPVLHQINFEIKPGEMVAIVGATGAGKTTVVSLIERFYDPTSGQVLLDGIDLREWSKQDLRSQIGLVMQDVFIFSGSLQENITLGQDRLGPDAIERAAREVNALPFIQRLPEGFHQEIGEGGSNLSGGERQLLSFARALAYDPKILILDEATSSVDPETERLIQEAIFRMTKKRTTLVVAHRLSTIQRADRILVMHHGRIREQGTHDELMALGGIYFRLNKLKAKGIVNSGQ